MTPLHSSSLFTRVSSIDLLRGLIMVIMALDHTRDYFHAEALVTDPTDLTRSSAAVFLTRWITHFCAPAFLFLSGLSAYLKRGRSTTKELSRYLLIRGLWLMLLDVTVLRFAVLFNFYPEYNMVSILWLIGGCMVMLSGFVYLRQWAILAIALTLIFGHNLFDAVNIGSDHPLYIVWVLF